MNSSGLIYSGLAVVTAVPVEVPVTAVIVVVAVVEVVVVEEGFLGVSLLMA